MRMLVVGAGATGGYFGGRLAQAGKDISFLVRAKRAELLRAEGLQIVSPHGDAVVRPKVVTADAIDGTYDAVLLSVKAFSLGAAMEDFAPAVREGTMIMPLLNGMRQVDALKERFGAGQVVGGVCKIAAMIDPRGRIVQLANFQELLYGELGGAASERIAALDGFMQGAGFKALLSGAIEHEMWMKWIMLASAGGACCLIGADAGGIEAAGGAEVARGFVREAAAVSTAAGFTPDPAFVEGFEKTMTTPGSKFNTSMYRDMQQGFAVEAEQIVGDMARRGQALGVPVPLMGAAFARLRVYEKGLG